MRRSHRRRCSIWKPTARAPNLVTPWNSARLHPFTGRVASETKPLLVGSVKANISHLEAAGGISGLIKTVLSLHHGIIPPQVHFDEPSPHIPWKRLPIKMVTETTPWPESDERLAGVTALGLVGTNAHIILGGAPCKVAPKGDHDSSEAPAERPYQLLNLSARTEEELATVAETYLRYVDNNPQIDIADLCHTRGCRADGITNIVRRLYLVRWTVLVIV